MRCWYCGEDMIWESDFNYDEVYGEGDGIVTYLHCPSCGADCKFSRRDDEVDNRTYNQIQSGSPFPRLL